MLIKINKYYLSATINTFRYDNIILYIYIYILKNIIIFGKNMKNVYEKCTITGTLTHTSS